MSGLLLVGVALVPPFRFAGQAASPSCTIRTQDSELNRYSRSQDAAEETKFSLLHCA